MPVDHKPSVTGRRDIYDPLYHTSQEDLYEVYAELRSKRPVHFSESRGVWCLTRHDHVQAAARNWKRFSNTPGVQLDQANNLGPGNFLDMDPPRHDVLRNVIRPFFVPKAIARLESDVARRVQHVMSELRERGSAELAESFVWQIPVWVLSRLLGVPESDAELVQSLVMRANRREPGGMGIPDGAAVALGELRQYVSALAEDKRRHPDERVLSAMVADQHSGAPTPEETVGLALILFIAGREPPAALLGNMLELLSRHDDAREAVRQDQSLELVDKAIEEVVRFEAPVQYLARTLLVPTTLHGTVIPGGERVILVWGAANRDEARWARAEEFDIRRTEKRQIGFGEGIHFCIGAPLARLEARVAVPVFLRTFSEYDIAAKRRLNSHNVRGWELLEATLLPQ